MIRCLTREKRGKRGFTMMEVLVVVGIIAVIAAIAIPSVISMRKNMDYKQRCDYAKTIFLAAQSNLADLRSTGELKLVEDASNSHGAVLQQEDAEKAETEEGGTTGNLPGGFVSRYIYTANSGGTADDRYAQVLPVNAVESTIRDQNVIIEYNPRTGIVHAVFYAEGNYDLLGNYQKGMLKRDEQWLKENLVGYYGKGQIGGDVAQDEISEGLDFYTLEPYMSFENGQEAILNIDIPTQYTGNGVIDLIESGRNAEYIQNMEIYLTVIGENSGMFTKQLKKSGQTAEDADLAFKTGSGVGAVNVVKIPVVLDSLMASKGLLYAEENKKGINSDNTIEYHVKPGDNISVALEITYAPEKANDKLIIFDDAVLAGINPLFHSVTGEAPNCTVAIANGRHLQNLNSMDVSVAGGVNTITFVRADAQTEKSPEINWKDTVNYYWETYKNQNVSYFAPIDHQQLVKTEVDGKYAVISNLDISSDGVSKSYVNYAKPVSNATEVGLFRTINGSVHDLRIVNPVIQGNADTKAVGALAGSAGTEAVIHNCYVYVDTDEKYFSWDNLDISDNFKGGNTKYGVSGYTAVGGMVGYSDNTEFENCLAAVPVFGNMYDAKGEAVGVGGFVGEANNGKFIKCYTSARTLADGVTYNKSGMHGSCGLGGFVGTSVNAKYINCFASGNVTSYTTGADARAVSGGFVGVAIRENNYENGLFNSCYALGTVRNKDGGSTQQAKFVGMSYSGTGLEKHDFYKDLLDSNNSGYIFRDCYYLQGKSGVVNADDYTLPATFDMLYDLHNMTYADKYVTYICSALGNGLADNSTKETIGRELNKSGFASGDWMHGLQSQKDNSHYPYIEGYKNHGANYPYSMLTGMPFYGIWPDAPSEVGIAYVEIYDDNSMGFYYDEMDKMSLQNKTVIADGYVILSANGGNSVEVTLNDANKIRVLLAFPTTIGRNEYMYGFIPVNTIPTSNNFYTKVEIDDTAEGLAPKNYTMYFNPNVAGSQLNPSGTKTEADNPGSTVPSTIYIHSARQLNALASDKMKPFWGADYTLVGTIDFDSYGMNDEMLAKYGFSEDTVGNYGVLSHQLVSIGTDDKPFTGKLTGAYNATVKVQGTAATVGAKTGLIGVLGANGQVSGITITGTMELGNNEGALVNVMNGGTLKDCAVNAVITSNSETAGLVVGALNGGTIVDCVSTGENTTLGFVGTAATGTPAMVAVNEGASHYGTDYHEDGIITEDEIAKLTDITTEDKTHTKRNYVGLITGDCTYVINKEPANAVNGVTYYYAITGENSYQTEESAVGAFTQVTNLKLSDFDTTATGDWVRSGYYYTVSGSDKYYPLYKKVEVREVIPEPVAAIDAEESTPTEGGGDGTTTPSESTTPTEPPKPVKYYTYHFRIPNGQGGYSDAYTFDETSNPESVKVDLGIGAAQLATLYTLKNISSMSNGMYLFRGTDGKVLTAVPENAGSDTITKNMIWNYDGTNWINLEHADSKMTPAQVEIPDTGSGNEMIVKVGTREYRIYKVEENTDREVKLVDQDSKYSTTDPSDDI